MASELDLDIDIQVASTDADLPDETAVTNWVSACLTSVGYKTPPELTTEMTLRFVDETESQALNKDYRNKDYATNVLSFPFEGPEGIPLALLGDLVVCAPVVKKEALEQGKPIQNHWAHMVVHGTLHLLGYDHAEAIEAEQMEALEVQILQQLDIADPYQNYHEL